MNQFYKEKDWYYFSVEPRSREAHILKAQFHAQWNPANKEYYVKVELWNMKSINDFIGEYMFIEREPKRKSDIKLLPVKNLITKDEVKLILNDIGFGCKLRDYQLEGVVYTINHGNCINGSDCGLGKSNMTIAYLELMDLFPCIIVCPSTVKAGWKKEWTRANPNRTVSIIGTSTKDRDWNADVIVINYDLLGISSTYINKKGEEKKKVEVKFPELTLRQYKAIVSDEIHMLKNSKANRSKAFNLLAKNINVVLGLTGTLIMNRPSELANILKTIGWYNSLFPDWTYFNYRYCNMKVTPFGQDCKSSSNIEELYRIVSHYCYFRKEKRDVLTELPPITEQVIEMEIKNRKIYNTAENDLISYLQTIDPEKAEKAILAPDLVQLQVLLQLTMEGKIKGIELFIKEWIEANEDSKLLVFGIHKAPLTQLTKACKNSRLITGDLSLTKKMSIIQEFKTDPTVQVLFANIQCIGTGVDGLQEVCSDAIFIELPFRPSDLGQAVSRLERMGQKDNINVYYLLAPDTIDIKMWNLLSKKKGVTDQVIKGYDDDISFTLLKTYANNDVEKRDRYNRSKIRKKNSRS